MNPTVLVIDDDPRLIRLVQANLEARGYRVQTASDGAAALAALAGPLPDLVLLDLMLPDMDGLDVCRRAREFTSLPIIILSARGEEQRKVQALDLGADDYLTKPFGVDELLARIRAVLRRAQRGEPNGAQGIFAIGDLRIDFARRRVTMGEREIPLTPTEYSLLRQLAAHPSRPQTHQVLLQQVWGRAYSAESEYLHVYVSRLRRKIEPDPANPTYILTVPGVGYKLREP